MFSAKFLVLSQFSDFWGQIQDYFWTWTDKIIISRFSRFPGPAGNPVFVYEIEDNQIQWTNIYKF